MSGRLIILPKKSWNVWNRENVARVRNDEKAHAEKVEAEQQQQRRADAEARLRVLKQQADVPTAAGAAAAGDGAPPPPPSSMDAPARHVNFFADAERALGTNDDHEAEKKARDLRELRRLGMAPLALGAGSVEADGGGQQPWYLRGPVRDGGSGGDGAADRERQRKRGHDPMSRLIKDDGRQGALPPPPPPVSSSLLSAASTSPVVEGPSDVHDVDAPQRDLDDREHKDKDKGKDTGKDKRKHKHKDKRKHKGKHRDKHKKRRRAEDEKEGREQDDQEQGGTATASGLKAGSSLVAASARTPAAPTDLAALRAKRQKREAMERARTSFMLTKHASNDEEAAMMREHAGRYHSQFHPSWRGHSVRR